MRKGLNLGGMRPQGPTKEHVLGCRQGLLVRAMPPTCQLRVHPTHVHSSHGIFVTQDMMRCPVVASDGYTYEQVAVRQWMAGARGGPARSPLTNLPFAHGGLVPNLALRGQIRGWLEERAGEVEKISKAGKQVDMQSSQGRVDVYVMEEGEDAEVNYGGPTAEDKA